jgi:hypothetical protein
VAEVQAQTCRAVRDDDRQQLVCERALEDLFEVPDCMLAAATAIAQRADPPVPSTFPRAGPGIRRRPLPTCAPSPPLSFEADPNGPVEIVAKTEGAAIAGLRGVVVALSNALVVARAVTLPEARSGAVDLTLGRFRGRLDPGQHYLQVWLLFREPGFHDASHTSTARCLMIQSGMPTKATVNIAYLDNSLGTVAGLIAARVEVQ